MNGSTGIETLDRAIGAGGYPLGIVEVSGSPGAGKSALACIRIARMQRTPSHVCAVVLGPSEDPDAWKVLADRAGVDLGRVLIVLPESLGEACDIAFRLIRDGGVKTVVFDGWAVTADGDDDALGTRLFQKFLRKVTPHAFWGTTVIVCQTDAPRSADGRSGRSMAVRFYSSLRIALSRRGDGPGWVSVLAKILKNKVGEPFGEAAFDLPAVS